MIPRLILGIESSCDETSAAVVADGRDVRSNIVASQLVHANYGGVVPELASREHLRNIIPVVREAMSAAGVKSYRELSAVAVTEGPGLAGALLVGITFAKALAFGAELPLIAVNHLEGHIQAVLLEAEQRFAEASPLLAAVVSGGHSHLYLASRDDHGLWSYRNVGRTVDDAAGEAFDKVAKLLGLPYPGGPWMDALATHGNPAAVPFRFAQIKTKSHGRTAPKLVDAAVEEHRRFDVSFSGIKTAVRRYTELHGMRERIAARAAAMRSAGAFDSEAERSASLRAGTEAARSRDAGPDRQLSGLRYGLLHAHGHERSRALRSARRCGLRRGRRQPRAAHKAANRRRKARSPSGLSFPQPFHR